MNLALGRFASSGYFTASGYSLGQHWWHYLSWTFYITAKLSARLPRGQLMILFTLHTCKQTVKLSAFRIIIHALDAPTSTTVTSLMQHLV